MPEQALQRSNMTAQDSRGLSYPEMGDADGALTYVKNLFRTNRTEMTMRAKEAMFNTLFVDGEQWIDWNRKDREWRRVPNPDGRVREIENLIKPVLRARHQRLISSEINFSAIARSNALGDRDRAKLSEAWLNGHWHTADMNDKANISLMLAFPMGGVFWKQFWNPDIGPLQPAKLVLPHPRTQELTEYFVSPQGEPMIDDLGDPIKEIEGAFSYRPGDVDTAVRTMYNVMVNPEATGLTSGEGFRWLIDSDVIPVHVARERYDDPSIQPITDDGIDILRFQRFLQGRVGGQSFVPTFPSNDSGPGVSGSGSAFHEMQFTTVHEYWEQPSEVVPNGRLIVIAGGKTIIDSRLPYDLNQVPYIELHDESDPFSPYGRPVVRDLVPPQKTLNEQKSLLLEELKRLGFGQFIAFNIPGMPDQISNEPSAITKIPMRAALQGSSVTSVINRMSPANPPRDRYDLIEMSRRAIFDIGAFHEISRGSIPPGIESGIAVQLLQESENMQFADAIRGLKTTFIRWAEQSLAIAKWGYSDFEDRWIPSFREDMDFMVESIKAEQLASPGEIRVDLRGFEPRSKAALNAQVMELAGGGLLDGRTALKLLDIGRGREAIFESETRHYARARRINKAIEEGRYIIVNDDVGMPHVLDENGRPFVNQFDDNAIHLDVLMELVLDETRPERVQQVAEVLASERRLITISEAQSQIERSIEIERQAAQATSQPRQGA